MSGDQCFQPHKTKTDSRLSITGSGVDWVFVVVRAEWLLNNPDFWILMSCKSYKRSLSASIVGNDSVVRVQTRS
jgi:hypothetical protein